MSIILVLIPLSIVFAVAFLAAFIWAVRSGQYEDTCTPSMRLLLDDPATGRGAKIAPPSPRPSPPGEGDSSSASGHHPRSHTDDDEDSGFTRTKAPSAAKDIRTLPKPPCAPPLLGGEGRGEGEC